MLSFKKFNFYILLAFLFLIGCGYKSLVNFQEEKNSVLNSGKFEIFSPKNEVDFYLRGQLLSDFGFPENPKYKILVDSSLERKKSIITENNEITRYNLIIKSNFKLMKIKNNKIILNKNYSSQTAFSASKIMSGFTTKIAKNSAEKRLAQDIADKIRMEVLILGKELLD